MDTYKYFTGGEVLSSDQSQLIKQAYVNVCMYVHVSVFLLEMHSKTKNN